MVEVLNRVLMIAGEASGDLHGAGVARALRARRNDIDLFGIGGDAMQREGVELIFHCSRLSFMGFLEVLRNLPAVYRVERTLVRLLEERRPDVVVLGMIVIGVISVVFDRIFFHPLEHRLAVRGM